MGAIGDVIPTLSADQKHLLWLDYDGNLERKSAARYCARSTYLTGGSILLVTIDVEPPTNTDTPKDWKEYFKAEAGEYLDSEIPNSGIREIRAAQTKR